MRLDLFLCEKGLYSSRTKASQAVQANQVLVNGKFAKCSLEVSDSDKIEIIEEQKFVSLGGYKLEKALIDFDFSVCGKVFADIGASTGGFTDCLLQRGASHGYALDVGESLLDKKIASNSKVVAIDNTNARFLTENTFPEKVDLAVVDCSFISLKYVLQPISKIIKENGNVIALIKPQFECGKKYLNKNGIVSDKKVLMEVSEEIYDFAVTMGFVPLGFTNSPIKSGKNIEFLILLGKTGKQIEKENIIKLIKNLGG